MIQELQKALISPHPSIGLFAGGTAPENLTGEILRFEPSHILLVDAADLGLKPGTVKLIDPETIGGASFSTHALPLKILADYLRQSLPCPARNASRSNVGRHIIILGIQPKQSEFDSAPSREIKQAARRLAREILHAASVPAESFCYASGLRLPWDSFF